MREYLARYWVGIVAFALIGATYILVKNPAVGDSAGRSLGAAMRGAAGATADSGPSAASAMASLGAADGGNPS